MPKEQLRTFHLTGHGLDHSVPDAALWPSALEALASTGVFSSPYPICVSSSATPQPVQTLVAEPVLAARPSYPVLSENIPQLRTALELSSSHPGGLPLSQALNALQLDLPEAAARHLQLEIEKLRRTLPQDGILLPFHSSTLPLLHGAVLTAVRRQNRENFLASLTRTRNKLLQILAVDDSHAPAGASAATLSSSLGNEGSQFFDSTSLAAALSKTRGPRRLEALRRERIEYTLSVLDQYLEESSTSFYLFHCESNLPSVKPDGEERLCDDPVSVALDFCDTLLQHMAAVCRALRSARLDLESAYEPAIHDERLERFDWQSATREEIAALPTVVVLETSSRLNETSLRSFSRLLRSHLPIQLLIAQPDALSTDTLDFSAIAMATREAFVLQSSLAHPAHLTAGLTAMAETLRPAVAVVAVPCGEPFAAAAMLHLSRAFPLFSYNPSNGESWKDRFQLYIPPQATESLTAAHAAALYTSLRVQFRILPSSEFDAEQLEINEYLRRFQSEPPLAIPYLELGASSDGPQRAALTRELAVLCLERRRAFRVLEELAGVRNAYVEAATAALRLELAKGGEAAVEQARLNGAATAIGKLVQVLTGTASLSTPQLSATRVAAAPVPLAPKPAPAALSKKEAPVEEPVSSDPYIDAFLCTSCNDCMKVNPRLFLYNANKQAYLGPLTSGTFADLVKAAEGCPARCIHPGAPRPGDTTATPAVLARAAKLK